jgi:hypothetical protein
LEYEPGSIPLTDTADRVATPETVGALFTNVVPFAPIKLKLMFSPDTVDVPEVRVAESCTVPP